MLTRPNADAVEETCGPIRLLLVEDEAVLAMDLSLQLQDMGYQVCATADRSELAIELALSHHPDLVLMDIVIKGRVDGIGTSDIIARELQIPVVFLSAYGDPETVARAARTAPYGYVTKPYKPRELRAAIEVALYKSRLERRLRDSEKWFSEMLRCVADGVVATDPGGLVKFMNPAAEQVLGRSFELSQGLPIDQLFRLTSLSTGREIESPMTQALGASATASISFAHGLVLSDGRRLPVDTSAAPIRSEHHEVLGAVLAFRDISARLATEEALRHSEERFRSAFDLAPAGMALIALDGRFLECNSAMLKLLDCSVGQLPALDQLQVTHPDDRESEQQKLKQLLGNECRSVQFEKRYRRGNRDYVWTLVSVSLLSSHHQPLCFLYQVHDLSRHKEYEHQLMRLAHFDGLTGLHNRDHMRELLDRMIVQASRSARQLAVVFIDLDHFKEVNDTLGHDAGDHVLQVVARRLKNAVRRSDAVGRLGGDEFLVVLPDIAGAADIGAVLHKINVEFTEPVHLRGHNARVSLSIGVALFPADGHDSVSLLRCADSALYHAKEQGRANWQFYQPEMTLRVRNRMTVEAELRNALGAGELRLHYQPLVPLQPGRRVGFEALLRWQHATRGLLQPDAFLDVAESSGLIQGIGAWVLHQACRDAAAWTDPPGLDAPEVAVNISVRQFSGGSLIATVRSALDASGLAPARLCLEISERLWLRDTEQNHEQLNGLKALGVRIAIDDFGVGYSSFDSIERLQPHVIKIDGKLVRSCAVDPKKGNIVRAVIAMAHNLGADVVAECVESTAQRDLLLAEACDYAQGFLYSRAVPIVELATVLTSLPQP